MMNRFVIADRETDYLFPPSVSDWLPDNHLARFIAEIVAQLDLTEITRQYQGRGSKAHHPVTLLNLLIYGYATGVFSSRKIERASYDSIAFRYLAANTHPDHDTIATKRDQHHLSVFERFTPDAPIPDTNDPVILMKHRLNTQSGRALYALKKQTVEPVFGIIKHVMGFRQFSMRGKNKAAGEWTLATLAWNLKRMNTLRMV